MAGEVQKRLDDNGITIPRMAAPAANYVPYAISGNLIFVAGQVPFENGKLNHAGKVGRDLTVEEAREVAAICGLNIIAAVAHALDGDLDRVTRCVKLGGFVNCVDGFGEQPEVINGASDLMVAVFGEAGKHARFAVGANALPRDVPVEIDAIFEFA